MAKLLTKVESHVVDSYLNGASTHELSVRYDCSRSVIKRILLAHRIALRDKYSRCRKIPVDETYFDSIDNAQKAYFLGLLYADGCIKWKDEAGYLQLAMVEKELIIAFRSAINSKHRISHESNDRGSFNTTNNKLYFLRIGSTKLARQLTSLGCKARKSSIIEFPSANIVPKKLLRHFIRGYFDGDGSVSFVKNTYPVVQISSSKSFHLGFCNYLDNLGIHFIVSRDKSILRLSCKYRVAEKFLDFIYQDSKIHLTRKYNTYLRIKEIYGK